jgi:hypothetical protein
MLQCKGSKVIEKMRLAIHADKEGLDNWQQIQGKPA